MLAGMLKVPAEIWSSDSSGGAGRFMNMSMSDSMDAYLVLCLSLDFGEGVLDFFEVFEYFQFEFGI